MAGRIQKRMAGPGALTTGTKYTVPSNRRGIIRHIHVANGTAGALPITLSIGADAAGTRIFDAYSVAANTVLDHFCYYVLEAAETLVCTGANALVLTVDGDEEIFA